jgi:DNA-binding CsgD family transcriptional regulator
VNLGADDIAFHLPARFQPKAKPFGLTAFELAVLQKLADGYRLKELASHNRTAARMHHIAYLMRVKMRAITTEHAVAIAFREGLVK